MNNVYTDGACINNGYKNASAGIGVFFGDNDLRNISKKINGKQTNNTAELTAVKEAILLIKLSNNYTIYTDSNYVIKCCTTYGKKQADINWKKNIPNKNLVKEIYTLYNTYNNINLKYIKAHTNNDDIHSYGNKMADLLAKKSIQSNNKDKLNKFNKIYFNVPYSNKDLAKQLGCRWDSKKKKWYTFENNSKINILNKLFTY